jgi:SpoVK/Ycf46/Vps4 family AAA+-type ATPase
MSQDKSVDFITYLDKYKSLRQCKFNDYVNMLSVINNNYNNSKIGDINFVGNYKKTRDNANSSSYYSNYSTSIWNSTCKNEHPPFETMYTLWQKKHETDISMNMVQPKKYKVTIETKVETINDLLKIIDENEYNDETEYNIDLKTLHNIKKELTEMNNMIGMDNMKKSIITQLLYFIQELHIGRNISEFKHTVIYGSPGTGKTEIAKILGNMYSKIGILKNNIFKKVTRHDLIAGYLGQTAIKTKKVIEECLGGVLFIDEAYSLASPEHNDSYSKECLDTLCEALSDHKNNLMVIIAGYEEELEDTFFKANRGLESRFIWRFKMDAYNPVEMMNIFKKKVLEHEWNIDDIELNEKWFRDKKDNFINFGRDMELLFSYTKIAHGNRIYGKSAELRKKLILEDINAGYDTFLKNRKKKKENTFMHSIFI